LARELNWTDSQCPSACTGLCPDRIVHRDALTLALDPAAKGRHKGWELEVPKPATWKCCAMNHVSEAEGRF